MSENPLITLHNIFGQSVWQDFIPRDMLSDSGALQEFIDIGNRYYKV